MNIDKEIEERLIAVHKLWIDTIREQMKVISEEKLQLQHPNSHLNIESRPASIKELLLLYGIDNYFVPNFSFDSDDILVPEVQLEQLDDFPIDIFTRWKVTDIPVFLMAGILGAGASFLLKDIFHEFHQEWMRKDAFHGGHGAEIIDQVPGSKSGGGFGHRWKYGHDIFNPFEVDWQNYFKWMPEGSRLPSITHLVYYFIRHLIQDTFSIEGLAFPGHSYFRGFLEDYINSPAGRQMLQTFATIKTRDITGTAITNILMGVYLWGTGEELSKITVKPNYRTFSLMAGANLTNLLVGFMMPTPSFNISALPLIMYYGGRMVWLSHKAQNLLASRQAIVDANLATLSNADDKIRINDSVLEQRKSLIRDFEEDISSIAKVASELQVEIDHNLELFEKENQMLIELIKINTDEQLLEYVLSGSSEVFMES